LPEQPHVPNLLQLKRKGNTAVVQLLVQWDGWNEHDATWWDADEIEKNIPDFV